MHDVSDIAAEFALLRQCLACVPDPRHARGRVHPLVGVLSLTVLALMAGARSLSDIARWGKLHSEIWQPLGLRRSPSVPTLSRLLRLVSVRELRTRLLAFARQLSERRSPSVAGLGEEQAGKLTVVAADGKTLRGAWEDGKQLHVLHLFATEAVLALDQVAVNPPRGEVEAAKSWVEQIAQQFPGLAILTGDALLVDRDLCTALVEGQLDYLFRLKKTN